MEDKEWQYEYFKVFVKNGAVNIKDGEKDIFVGMLDGGRFGVLKDAMAYINAMKVLEELENKK